MCYNASIVARLPQHELQTEGGRQKGTYPYIYLTVANTLCLEFWDNLNRDKGGRFKFRDEKCHKHEFSVFHKLS